MFAILHPLQLYHCKGMGDSRLAEKSRWSYIAATCLDGTRSSNSIQENTGGRSSFEHGHCRVEMLFVKFTLGVFC